MNGKFKVGDKVTIERRLHPWNGEDAVIIAEWPDDRTSPDWRVRIERGDLSGHECAVRESDLRMRGES